MIIVRKVFLLNVDKSTFFSPNLHLFIFRPKKRNINADFVQCTLWRKAAENTCQYCRKGSVVGITGRLQTRNYDNKEGKRVYVTEVVAETVRFLGAKPQGVVPEQKQEEVPIG